jgi:hypothetical protein
MSDGGRFGMGTPSGCTIDPSAYVSCSEFGLPQDKPLGQSIDEGVCVNGR